MPTAEKLYEARWIVPVEPVGEVLEGHTLVTAGDRIVALLPVPVARSRYPDAERIALPRHLLIPGLVNAHTHAAMTLLRGYADDYPLEIWLREHVWPAEGAFAGAPGFVRDGTRLAIAEMLRSGTTCFADQYFFADQAAAACSEAGIRAQLGVIVIDFPTPWARSLDEYLEKGLAVRDAWKHDPLVGFVFAPHSPYTVGDDALTRVRVLANELDLPVQMHVHETADELATALAASGERPLARLARLGLLNPSFSAVHATQLDDADIAALADSGAGVVHCPQSNLKLASGFCPVARLLAAGVNVALGTDGAGSNNDLDLLDEMRTASLLAKGVAGDASALSAHAALRMATLAGAQALCLTSEIGSLEAGKQADFIAVDLDRAATTPVYDPVHALVYAATREQITDVWVAGRRLLADGALTTLDDAEVRANARAWAQKISARRAEAVA
ncbi:MAG: TRZ/ATZ family hydrolase [Gammaproteobacteria bacterium]